MFALTYHESTKHHFDRFAPYLGYLDWANQPDPFRRYAGARLVDLPRAPAAGNVAYAALFDRTAPAAPFDLDHLGELLRCSMGLSGWKQAATTLWPLRVNPSSGNLHPTETYLVFEGRVAHYAPREHALEERATLAKDAWTAFCAGRRGALVGLTSIHWREAWKYGERAFRYCQHDAGHAIGALRLAAAMLGWHLVLLPRWSTAQLAALLGVDHPMDAEPEEPECLAILTPDDPGRWPQADPEPLVHAAGEAQWRGSPNLLSAGHVDWPAIERVALATRSLGSGPRVPGSGLRAHVSSYQREPVSRPGARSPEPLPDG